MNTSTAIITLGSSTVTLPTGTGITQVSRGKSTVAQIAFAGKSRAALRAEGKARGLKGRALRIYAESEFRGESANGAWIRFDALTSAARSSGLCPETGTFNVKGDGLTLKLFRPPVVKAKTPAPDVSGIIARLKAKGHSDAEIAEIVGQ